MRNGLPFTILLVDDDGDDRLMIDEAFAEIGYASEVKKFINGKALLQYLEQLDEATLPSLIVLDNSLPGLDAGDLLSLLKANPLYQSIPVVIYTTSLSATKKEELLSKGAYAFFEKGNTMEEIVQVANKLINFAENTGRTAH
jgi:CheY-like chemotaxis protein